MGCHKNAAVSLYIPYMQSCLPLSIVKEERGKKLADNFLLEAKKEEENIMRNDSEGVEILMCEMWMNVERFFFLSENKKKEIIARSGS